MADETFNFGIGYGDWRKIVWTFVQALLGYAIAVAVNWVPGDPWDWKAFGVGLLAAGVSFVKNFVLSDQSAIK